MGVLRRLSRAFFRPVAFISKEFTQIWRQPRLILTLIVGPFLVLLLFGIGYNGKPKPIATVLVLPADSGLSTNVGDYCDQFGPPFQLVGVTNDEQGTEVRLRERRIDAAIVFPDHAYQTIESGKQASLLLLYNELDPLQRTWLEFYGYVQTSEFNRRVLQEVLARSRLQANAASASDAGPGSLAAAVAGIPPQVMVAPFRPTARNLAPTSPGFVAFYSPGVLALLIQHVAVTLTALALVRERLSGAVELFRVSPVGPGEILLGKYVSYFVQTGVLSAILVLLVVVALDVPMLGQPAIMALVLALLETASLGVGFFISAISRTETQAVQFSLLVLLAAVFFSGFFLPLTNLIKPVWAVSYALPVTYGIQALQLLMLRGETPPTWILAALAGMTAGFLLLTAILFRRDFRRL